MSKFKEKLEGMSPELWPTAIKLSNGNVEDAKDLIQKTFVKALEKKELFKDDSNQIGWVVTIMKNIHIDEKRKGKGKTFVHFQEEAHTTTNPEPLEVEDTIVALKQLGKRCQSVLMLIAEGYKYSEIAHQLELPLGTVMSRLLRCRQQLFKALNSD
jgi:RNA polymerase sigma-70 factor, ECF subfamily